MKYEALHFLKTNASIFAFTQLNFCIFPMHFSVKIFMFQQCREFIMTADYVNREKAHILN